jgi:hypothetical protein
MSGIAARELKKPIAWRLDLIEHCGDAGAVGILDFVVATRNVDMDPRRALRVIRGCRAAQRSAALADGESSRSTTISVVGMAYLTQRLDLTLGPAPTGTRRNPVHPRRRPGHNRSCVTVSCRRGG